MIMVGPRFTGWMPVPVVQPRVWQQKSTDFNCNRQLSSMWEETCSTNLEASATVLSDVCRLVSVATRSIHKRSEVKLMIKVVYLGWGNRLFSSFLRKKPQD